MRMQFLWRNGRSNLTFDILAAANRVKAVVEQYEGPHINLTLDQLESIPTYQFTVPTAPRPGFRYKREYTILAEKFWYVFTCVRDPDNSTYVLHKPERVVIIS